MAFLRRSNDIEEVSNSTSFYALISLVAIFLTVVTYGWATMLATAITLPNNWPEGLSPLFSGLRYLAGFAIAAAGVVLGKAVAAERIRLTSEQSPMFKHTWKGYFLVLLLISALGTMNTFFMQTQQGPVLSEVISKTRHHLQQLKFQINEKLATPAYDQSRIEIDQVFSNFEQELRNPANCGFGAQSNKRFIDLQKELPKLKPLALGSGACQNINALISAYKDTVNRLVDDLPDPATKKRYSQRLALSAQLTKTMVSIEELKVKNANLDKSTAMPTLIAAWSTYSQALQEAELISGKAFGLPPEIVDKNALGMGNITQIVPLLLSQLDNPVTYLIILAAVFFDVLLIEFFSRYMHGRVVIRKETYYSAQPGAATGRTSNLFEE
jgi:hypothetical protein